MRHFLKIGKLAQFLTVLSNSLKSLKQWYCELCFPNCIGFWGAL